MYLIYGVDSGLDFLGVCFILYPSCFCVVVILCTIMITFYLYSLINVYVSMVKNSDVCRYTKTFRTLAADLNSVSFILLLCQLPTYTSHVPLNRYHSPLKVMCEDMSALLNGMTVNS